MELSLREALQLGHNYIGTEHILLGLIPEGENAGHGQDRAAGVGNAALVFLPISRVLTGERTQLG